MSSNDGTRSTDACESLLAHHLFPMSLNWLASRRGTFLDRMLLVNQANDHGEITGSGVADAVAHDAKDRIEVITDWNSGVDIDDERLNSYRRQLGAHQRRAGASHGLLALMTMSEAIAAKVGGAPRWSAFIDRAFVPICPIDRFIGISTLFLPARLRLGDAAALASVAHTS